MNSLISDAGCFKQPKVDRLRALYHPIVDAKSNIWVGATAQLGRFARNKPNDDAPARHLSRKTPQMTRRLCQEVVKDHAKTLWACENFYISISLSAIDLISPTFVEFVKRLITEYQTPASRLAFEIPDSTALFNSQVMSQLERLRACGHLIVLNDRDASYHALTRLHHWPIDLIQLDMTLIEKPDHSFSTSFFCHMLEMAKRSDRGLILTHVVADRQLRHSVEKAQEVQVGLHSNPLGALDLARAYFTQPHPCRLHAI